MRNIISESWGAYNIKLIRDRSGPAYRGAAASTIAEATITITVRYPR